MKAKYLISAVLLGIVIHANAQLSPDSIDDKDIKVFNYVEQLPLYPGGEAAILKFLKDNTHYPQMEKDNGIEGKVIIKFVVDEHGKVTDVTVARSVSAGLDKEGVRVVKMLPDFKPGYHHGKAVSVYYSLPFDFQITDRDFILSKQLKKKYPADNSVLDAIAQYKMNNTKAAIQAFKKEGSKTKDGLFYAMIAECYLKLHDQTNRCKNLRKAGDLGIQEATATYNEECGK